MRRGRPRRTITPMPAIEMQTQLQELQTERALASIDGPGSNSTYLADLKRDIATTRAKLSGPQVG